MSIVKANKWLRYLLLIYFLFYTSIIFCDDEHFDSNEQYNEWFTYYYLHPKPEKVPAAIKYYCDSPMFEKSNTRMPMTAFYAALFKNDPRLMERAYGEISSNSSENSKILFLNILWLVNTIESQELLSKAKAEWKSETIQKIIERMNGVIPADILSTPIKDPARLDMLWTTFLATGDSLPVKKIISVIHLRKDGHGSEIMIGGAADWSLTSNARQHRRVYEICKEKLKNSEGHTKKLLQKIVKKAEQQWNTN